METIRSYIENFVKLSESDWEAIRSKFQKINFEQDEIILQTGKISRYFYFQESGIVRFFINTDRGEISRAFLLAPCFFTSRRSFINRSPSNEGIHCIETVKGWRLSYNDYQKLFELSSWNTFMISLLNLSHDLLDQYLFDLLTYNGEERYRNMLNSFSDEVLQKIPVKYLASAIGLEPESLSRIRKKIRKT